MSENNSSDFPLENGARLIVKTEPLGLDVRMSRSQVERWLFVERAAYADRKYNDKSVIDDNTRRTGFDNSGWYYGFILNYLSRASVLGAESQNGRQALAKAAVTILECLESSIRVFGDLPCPGVSSGEIIDWGGCTIKEAVKLLSALDKG